MESSDNLPRNVMFASRRLGRRLSEYFDKSHNFTAITFMTSHFRAVFRFSISRSDISPPKAPDKDAQAPQGL